MFACMYVLMSVWLWPSSFRTSAKIAIFFMKDTVCDMVFSAVIGATVSRLLASKTFIH